MDQKPKMTAAQAFNVVVPAARGCQATGDQHDQIMAALLVLKELVESSTKTEDTKVLQA